MKTTTMHLDTQESGAGRTTTAPKVTGRILPSVLLIIRAAGYTGPATVGPDLLRWCSSTPGGRRRKILGTSSKVQMGEGLDIYTTVLYMSPSTESGFNLCPWASDGCSASCLGHSSGHLQFDSSKRARIGKTIWFKYFTGHFISTLNAELTLHALAAESKGMTPAARLNGSTDVLWERLGSPGSPGSPGIMEQHPGIVFYDYTKAPIDSRPNLPSNYHVLFSVSEQPESMIEALRWIDAGRNAAVVVGDDAGTLKGSKARALSIVKSGTFEGRPAISGDETDARHLDKPGAFVVLYAKGRLALRDSTGFVRRPAMAG